MEQLRQIPGMVIPEPEGAFYALPEVSAFFGPDVEADDFGSIPDVDALCRQASGTPAPLLRHSAYMQVMYSIITCVYFRGRSHCLCTSCACPHYQRLYYWCPHQQQPLPVMALTGRPSLDISGLLQSRELSWSSCAHCSLIADSAFMQVSA